MPANPKHLSTTGQRILKTTAGIIGGFMVTISFHNSLGVVLEQKKTLVITSAFSSFFLWVSLMVVAFLFKNGWKVWGLYSFLTLAFGFIIFLNK